MNYSTWLYFHDIFFAHLNLLESLDDIKGKGDRAGNTARQKATEEVDDEVMIPDILPLTGSDIYQFLENTVQNCAGENTSDIFQVRP